MSAIGGIIADPDMLEWDESSYYGSFRIFNDTEEGYELRCVVWCNDSSGQIIGHNFDYTRASTCSWWTADEAASPEECLRSVAPRSREQAARAVERFRTATYEGLKDGTIALPERRGRPAPLHAPEVLMRKSLQLLTLAAQ
ncbi:hypothetical protein [Sphingomonas xinjiangensis]|uniref:Uncharacterized protein n=1 Tax=Sphingomonas xinjiangensis TaxID=643568 RepID=A0A840YSG9_9SPHN|nr:hypothetical protein [Sphingomonas xinjiangensis]MBB5712625.1 hypothetical protein [Sphingomonas xinjiangensis]